MKVLVTGSTGYVGGRLVPRLLEAGHEVRCMTRNPERLRMHPWRDQVEVVDADALDADGLPAALDGCNAAFYLIHNMAEDRKRFAQRDRDAAANFAAAADKSSLHHLPGRPGSRRRGPLHPSREPP